MSKEERIKVIKAEIREIAEVLPPAAFLRPTHKADVAKMAALADELAQLIGCPPVFAATDLPWVWLPEHIGEWIDMK